MFAPGLFSTMGSLLRDEGIAFFGPKEKEKIEKFLTEEMKRDRMDRNMRFKSKHEVLWFAARWPGFLLCTAMALLFSLVLPAGMLRHVWEVLCIVVYLYALIMRRCCTKSRSWKEDYFDPETASFAEHMIITRMKEADETTYKRIRFFIKTHRGSLHRFLLAYDPFSGERLYLLHSIEN